MRMYLGFGNPGWLNRPEFAGIPRCVSRNQLAARTTIPESNGPVLIDSGAFTLLKDHGRWPITPTQYVAELRRYIAAIGGHNIAAIGPMDWMCEHVVIYGGTTKDGTFAGTRHHLGLPADATFDDYIAEHQRRTVQNGLELRQLAPDLPIMYALQGQTLGQYLRHVAMYQADGVDLTAEPLVGLGSVCRRQGTKEIGTIVAALHALGIRIHGFGVGAKGVQDYGLLCDSFDSQAWSYGGRKIGLCPHRVPRVDGRGYIKHEANCPVWALTWYRQVMAGMRTAQPAFDLYGSAA